MADPKLGPTAFSPVEMRGFGQPTITSDLASFGSPAISLTQKKQEDVALAAKAKKIAMADDETLRVLAAAERNDNRLADDAVLQDLRTLSYGEVVQKYGVEAADNRWRILQAETELGEDLTSRRSDWQTTKDTGIGVVQGAVNLAGSLAALGTGMINDRAGVAVSGAVQDVSRFLDGQKSTDFQEYKAAHDLMSSLDQADNLQTYNENVAAHGESLWEDLKYFGRAASDAAGRVIQDPVLLGDFAAQNVGSLVPSAGMAKAAQVISAGTKLAPLAVPAAVAAGESGAAYTGAVNRVMEMSPEDLAKNSPEYRSLIAKGVSHEDAVIEISTDAGMLAAAVQAPVAALAGKVVERFEVSPTSVGSLKEGLEDIGLQVLEEGFQEGTGQVSQNLGIQTFANENQELSEGVAEGAALGAVGGGTSAAAVKAPGLAGRAAVRTAQALMTGAGAVIDNRAKQAEAKRDAASPVGQQAAAQAATTAQEVGTQLVQKLDAATATSADPTAAPEADLQTKMVRALGMEQAEFDSMPASLSAMLLGGETLPEGQSVPRVVATNALIEAVKGSGVDGQTRKDAILWLHEQASLYEAVKDVDESTLTDEFKSDLAQMREQLDIIQSNPLFKRAVELAPTLEQKDLGKLPEITDENVNTPEVKAAVGNVVQLAHANPVGIDPAYARVILNQVAAGKIGMEAQALKRLEAAAQIAEIYTASDVEKENLADGLVEEETGPTVASVRRMILSDGKNNEFGQYGLKTHLGKILSAARAGNKAQAQVLMENLKNFAESMQNKVAAANESISRRPGADNVVTYQAWNGAGWSEGKTFVNARSANSLATGKAIAADAETVADIYDTLVQGLGATIQVQPLARVTADPRISTDKAAPATKTNTTQREIDLTPEPEEQAPAKERRLRKDAVLKTEESLIDQEDSDPISPIGADAGTVDRVVPKRPVRVKKDMAEPVVTNTETFEFDGVSYTKTPMTADEVSKVQAQLVETLGEKFNNAERLLQVVENWSIVETDDPTATGGFAHYSTRGVELLKNTFGAFVNKTRAIAQVAVLHEIGHLIDADMFFEETSANGNLSVGREFTDPNRPVGQEIEEILGDKKHLFHNFLHRYATTFEGSTRSMELFAELMALFMRNPNKFKEVAPNVHAYFAEKLANTYGVTIREESAEADTGSDTAASRASGRGSALLNGQASQAAAQEAEASPQEEAREARGNDERDSAQGVEAAQDEAGTSGEEAARTEPAADAGAKPGRLSNPFTNLVKSAKGVVRFVRAYTIDADKSKLVTDGAPIDSVLDSLENPAAWQGDLLTDYDLTPDQREAMVSLVQNEVRGLVESMNAKLLEKQPTLKGADKELLSPLDALAYGEKDFTSFKESRVLNLVDETTGEFDATLIQLAAMAAMHWAMHANPTKIPDAEDVAKMFGVSESSVTAEMMQASRNAVSGSLAVESLGREIMEFWGASRNGDAPMSDSLGIAQALAAELLSVMKDKITEESMITIQRDGKSVEAVAIKTSHPSTDERIKQLSYARSYLKEAFVLQDEKPYYFDAPPAQVRTKQKRNMIGNLGAKMQKALRRHQEQKFYRNTPFVDLMTAIGQDAWMDLMGYQKVSELMNQEHRLSVEGKNTQLQKSWEGVMAHNMRLEAHAAKADKEPNDVVTHFDVYAVSNERIHQDGFNPQSNKTMREAWVSTRSTLDLTQKADRDLFWLTVAQSSGLIKTEAVFDPNEDPEFKHAKTAAKAEAMMDAKYGKAIEMLMAQMRGEAFDGQAFAAEVKKAGGKTEKVVHSILAVARYRSALGSNETSFTHDLSLEADGKTDGPMAALVNHSRGLFSVAEIRNFRRGGFFLGQKGRTLNDQYAAGDVDLYQIAAKGSEVFLKAKIADMKEKGGGEHADAMLRFLKHFSEDFSYNEATGELTIKRGLLKNPLTVTVYGSGANGIADKISGALLEAFYQRLSELEIMRAETGNQNLSLGDLPGMQGYETALQDLQTLATGRIIKREDGAYFVDFKTAKGKNAPLRLKRPRDFVLSPENREVLSHNLRKIVVDPMRNGIGQVMANPQEVNAVLQQATQVQSQVMMAQFRQAVKETLAEKRASGELESGEFLSQNTYNEIYRKMSRFGAVIEPADSNENHLNLSGSESVRSSYEFTRSLEGKYGGNTRLPEPTDAGVAAAAMMTISRGDAMMMVNYFVSEDPDLRALAVFDGLEMPADGIETISRQINEAVAKAWMDDNGPKDLADSFADFTRQGKDGPFAAIKDTEALRQIAETLGLKKVQDEGLVSVLNKAASQLSGELNQIAREIQARKNAMKSMAYSMDHMASGRAPFDNEGEAFDADPTDPNYDDKLVGWLNLRYEEELRKLTDARTDELSRPSVAQPTAAFTKKIKELGAEMGYRPITRMSTRSVVKLLQSDAVSKDTRDVLAVIQKALPNFTFLFGSAEELTAYRDETYPEMIGMAPIDKGQTDMANRVVYIANGASETVLHEALHVASMQVVLDAMTKPESLDEVQKAAFENLQKMLDQFMDMDFSRTLRRDIEQEDGSVLNVAQELQRQIAEALARGDELGRAIALNEFMAWTLSNQNLIDVMRKTKVRTPLRDLVFKATGWIRKLLGLAPTQKLDMFSNMLINTGAILQGDQRSISVPSGVVLNQSLVGLMEKFETKVATHLRNLDPIAKPGEEIKILDNANHAVNHFQFHGFDMDAQQASAFRTIQIALSSSMQLDNRALVQAQRVFAHATKQLSPKDFEGYPDGNLRSQSRFDMLMGKYGYETDLEGRSNLLASFLALSQVDPEFRKVLEKIELPKDRQISYDSMDEFLTSIANSGLDTLASAIGGSGLKSRNSREALDKLALALAKIETDDQLWIEKTAQNFFERGDTLGSNFLSKTGERLGQWADAQAVANVGKQRNAIRDTIRQGAAVVGALIDENRGKAMASAAVSLGNQTRKVPTALIELMNEVIGMTDENEGVLGLINKVKASVSAMRQDYREEVPRIIAEKFTRELSDEEWSAMHLVLGKTDTGVLRDHYAGAQLRQLITDKAYLAQEIQQREEELRNTSRAHAAFIRKAKELAKFMVTGEVTNNNLLRNATAIAALMGENGKGTDDAGTIELIDILTTLYALEEVGQDQLDMVSTLSTTEPEGIDFLAGYLWSVAKDEKAKIQTDAAKFNHYKGYIPSERRDGIDLVVRDDSEHNALIARGYTRMGDYKGAGVETGKKGYYFSTVAGNGTYTQGAMQTVQQSASGVDPRTGRTISGTTAGVISGRYLGIIQQRLRNASKGPVEALLPVYDAKGNVVAYERHMAPHALAALERNTHMGEMLGAWAGRQAEEELGQEFNRKLVDNLKTIWDRDKGKRADEFVDLSQSLDKVHMDSWEMVPNDLRAYIQSVFGADGFPIRKDMINNAVGYRAASITDPWTGISRLDEKHQEAFVKVATAVMGKDAFTYLATAEKAIQAGVSVVKSTIVVRSIIIPIANLASNVMQLAMHGVSFRDMYQGYQTKLLEITKYQKNLKRKVDIEAEITAQRTNPDAVRRLETELKSLEDANRRMSIWPLVEAGEFATISEGLTEVDAALAEGKWAEYIQGLMDRVPSKLGTFGRYAFITRDTALFQGMARAMQYGDTLSKAVLYDHLVKQGKTKEQALRGVVEEFVNYNLLPGRTRSYVDGMGLAWFLAFKLRSIKIARQHIINHPFRALMLTLGNPVMPEIPGISLGSPIEDNFLSVAADGRLGYSIGPGMAFNAPSLHPWVNLTN